MLRVSIFPILCGIFLAFSACSGDKPKEKVPVNEGKPEPEAQETSTAKPNQSRELPPHATEKVTILPFDMDDLPAEIDMPGKSVGGARWKDRNGMNWLIITELTEGEYFSKGYQSNIYARCYNTRDGALKEYWAIKDFNQDIYQNRNYIEKSAKITDVDKDGFAESTFIYECSNGGMDPSGFKLMMHVMGEKYPIRGQLAVDEAYLGEQAEKKIDPVFDKIAPEMKAYASKAWDDFQQQWYDLLRE
ncbi:MAG: hypothetical protein AAF570_27185 [Bacteroidota bacterium]